MKPCENWWHCVSVWLHLVFHTPSQPKLFSFSEWSQSKVLLWLLRTPCIPGTNEAYLVCRAESFNNCVFFSCPMLRFVRRVVAYLECPVVAPVHIELFGLRIHRLQSETQTPIQFVSNMNTRSKEGVALGTMLMLMMIKGSLCRVFFSVLSLAVNSFSPFWWVTPDMMCNLHAVIKRLVMTVS